MKKLTTIIAAALLLCSFLYADFDREFAQIQKERQSNPSGAYTDLQSLYLGLIFEGSQAQKEKVLTELIDVSKDLGFSHERYSKELQKISADTQETAAQKQPAKKPTVQTGRVASIDLSGNKLTLALEKGAKLKRSFALKNNKYRYVFDFNAIYPPTSKTLRYGDTGIRLSQFDAKTVRLVVSSDTKLVLQQNKTDAGFALTLPGGEKNKPDTAGKPARIKATSLQNATLKMHFDSKPKYSDFILQRDKIRYVYDFHAIFPQVSQAYKYEDTSVKISQFDKDTVRMVVTTAKKLNLQPKMNDNSFLLPLGKQKQTPSIMEQANKKFRVVLDPGHGGRDPGAVGYRGWREKVVVNEITKQVKKYLEKNGIEAILTRDDDSYLKLSARTEFANQKDADVFVSIHANANDRKSLNGIETYFLSPARSKRAKQAAALENKEVMDKMREWSSKNTFLNLMNREKIIESNKLAIDIQKNMLYYVTRHYSDVRDSGVREAPFWVLVGAQMPAVLVELGYITNPKDAKRLVLNAHKKYQDGLARGIADGVVNYLSIAKGL
ncbi:MAG: N-acetylmuramoyl-L-alanine amidase [Campylobacterota bacterium]